MIEEVLKFKGDKKYIIVSVGNLGFLRMIINWAGFLKKLNISNYLVFALDKKTYDKLTKLKINTYLFHHDKRVSSAPQLFLTPEFNKITYTKMFLVHQLLKMEFNCLLSDVDTIWLEDPLGYMNIEEEFDLQMQINNESLAFAESAVYFNTGFFYARGNHYTADFFEKVLSEMSRNPHLDDQTCFNNVFQHEKSRMNVAFSNSCGSSDSSKLQIKALAPLWFPNGNLYFRNFANFKKSGIKPVVIHANFYDGLNSKIRILKKFNYWKVESPLKIFFRRLFA